MECELIHIGSYISVRSPSPDTMWVSQRGSQHKHKSDRKGRLLSLSKEEWRPVDSHKEAVKDIEIFLPSSKPTPVPEPEPAESESANGRFSVTFFMKEGEDGSEESMLPSGAVEASLPGNRKAVTFQITDKGAFLAKNRAQFGRKPVFHGMNGEDVEADYNTHYSQSLAEHFRLPREPTRITNKKLELRTASTFVIDKNWDMFNTHLRVSLSGFYNPVHTYILYLSPCKPMGL